MSGDRFGPWPQTRGARGQANQTVDIICSGTSPDGMPNSTVPKSFASPNVRALALGLNASIAAQKAAESSASFFVGIRFFIGVFFIGVSDFNLK